MEQTSEQKKNHLFQPGQSGNPSGRPKADISIRELAREHTTAAISTLCSIMQNPKAAPSARVHAASALLDRAWGKPSQHVDTVNLNVSWRDAINQVGRQMLADGDIVLSEQVIDVIPGTTSSVLD